MDSSQDIFEGTSVWPGHPETKITVVDTHESTRQSGRFEEDYGFTAEKIEMSTHGTTHTDSISHIDPAPEAQWGGELKGSGYDVLIIQGRAEKPTCLFIKDDRVELRDATEL